MKVDMELRVPPVLIVALAALSMWLMARALPPGPIDGTTRVVLATLFAVAGAVVVFAGIREFRVADTTVNPLQPEQATSMVTTGVFRWTRNPMYLGMLCLLAAWATWLGRVAPFVVLPAFVLYMNRFQIRPEERALERRFGAGFGRYAARVRRWL
jgi:protein-S-isoprenylcysteine O-methyltransferase Ste14